MPTISAESQVRVAAKLYQVRSSIKSLWGAAFAEKIEPYKGFVTAEMQKKQCNEITASMNIIRDLQRDCPDSGMTQVLILAACVELIEPTPSIV